MLHTDCTPFVYASKVCRYGCQLYISQSHERNAWDVLEFSNQPVQAAGALQESCRRSAHPLYMHIRYGNMDVIS